MDTLINHISKKKAWKGLFITDCNYCDYCGAKLFVGDEYYRHRGLRICKECADKYAWMIFEDEAELKREFPQDLIVND